MIVDLPGTSVAAVASKLRDLRDAAGAMALSRVLTLVVVVDDARADEALTVAARATHQHPSRIVAIAAGTRRGANRIDAQLRLGGDAGASEIIVLRLYGELVDHAESVVMPLLLPDSPIVAWWPYDAPEDPGADPIGALAQRRITDAEHAADAATAIATRAKVYRPGDTDLVWTRTTRWRGLLAAALDQPPFEPVRRVTVCGGLDSGSTDLLAAWLGHRLGCPVVRGRAPAGAGLLSVRLERESGPIDLVRPDGLVAILSHPGQPIRRLALARRSDEECLSDELARLDPDDVYDETLRHGLPLLRGKALKTVTEAVAAGLAPELDEARRIAAEIAKAAGGQGSAAMVERPAPTQQASDEDVRRRGAAQRDQVQAERTESTKKPPRSVGGGTAKPTPTPRGKGAGSGRG
ncbi:MAG: glucose-6-phosphate dehydrogenase assembly protein OpcA [Austwickia sp.]|nr:glucose-6-phosphate dehydrogenase assembly protein OpcA [Actinomycetota bacterium]MCB1251838.1 glucose-6-phosphate dehydrogenase assembly protein OpcA [Austwickia sp.]MCO5308795.1 glucose-6-phosphate dehydrogenase assembly protein OpcA [Austwickia sp.]